MIYGELSKENPFGEPSNLDIEEECQLFHLTHEHDGGSNNVLGIIVDLLFEAQLCFTNTCFSYSCYNPVTSQYITQK